MGLFWYGIVAAVVRGPFNIMYGAWTSRQASSFCLFFSPVRRRRLLHICIYGHKPPNTHTLPFPQPNPIQPKQPGVPCDLRQASCFWTDVCASAGFTNLLLLLFNLFIPAYPLDACRILVDIFALCKVRGWACGCCVGVV